jgi:hypothetical protein
VADTQTYEVGVMQVAPIVVILVSEDCEQAFLEGGECRLFILFHPSVQDSPEVH